MGSAGIEPAWIISPKDFKSFASACSATTPMVPVGIEPTRLSANDFESIASASSATGPISPLSTMRSYQVHSSTKTTPIEVASKLECDRSTIPLLAQPCRTIWLSHSPAFTPQMGQADFDERNLKLQEPQWYADLTTGSSTLISLTEETDFATFVLS